MELRDKKSLAERFIRLGMDVRSSLIACEATEDEIDLLLEDKQFMDKVAFIQAREVSVLLEKLDNVIAQNVPRGISTEIRWKLGKVDAGRFGEGFKGIGTGDKKKFMITFETMGATEDDNVEEFVPVAEGASDDRSDANSPI